MKTRAVRDGDTYVLNGSKRWITNAGISKFYTVMAVTDPGAGAGGISAFVVEKDDPGILLRRPRAQARHQGIAHRGAVLRQLRIPADRIIGAEGTGLQDRAGHP